MRGPAGLALRCRGSGSEGNQRDAQRQRNGDLGGFKAFVSHLLPGTLQKVIGGVIDSGAGHQREDAAQQKQRDRRAEADGKQPAGQRQRQGGRKGGHGRGKPQRQAQHIAQPGDAAADAAGKQMSPRNLKGDAEAQCGHRRHHKLEQILHHSTSRRAKAAVYARPTPQARQPATKIASSSRIAPER